MYKNVQKYAKNFKLSAWRIFQLDWAIPSLALINSRTNYYLIGTGGDNLYSYVSLYSTIQNCPWCLETDSNRTLFISFNEFYTLVFSVLFLSRSLYQNTGSFKRFDIHLFHYNFFFVPPIFLQSKFNMVCWKQFKTDITFSCIKM